MFMLLDSKIKTNPWTPREWLGWGLDGGAAGFEEAEDNAASQSDSRQHIAKYRFWRGASGRRYVFSAYGVDECPAYENAVVIAAAMDGDAARRLVRIAATEALPDLMLSGAWAREARARGAVEFHVHLLATSPRERRAVIKDLDTAQPRPVAF
jgi:hypothetical protein